MIAETQHQASSANISTVDLVTENYQQCNKFHTLLLVRSMFVESEGHAPAMALQIILYWHGFICPVKNLFLILNPINYVLPCERSTIQCESFQA